MIHRGNWTRVSLFLIGALTIAVQLAGASCASAEEVTRPNIVVILADDLGAVDLGCYGADLCETPRLDGLAKESVLFRQAYSSAPVCSPTRAALMTGKHPARLGITIWSEGSLAGPQNRKLLQGESRHDLPHAEVTLAERLHDAGYATALIGKWHLGDADHAPETQGFDLNIGGTRWGAPHSFFWPYRGTGRFGQEFRYVPGLPLGQEGDYLTDQLTMAALNFIDSAGDRPFFLLLAHHAPHTPIEAPAQDVKAFQTKLRPDLKQQNAGYAAMVNNLDGNVGLILDYLKARGLADKTIVVFTSDNGGYIGVDRRSAFAAPCTNNYPLRSGKGSLYEGGIRVPLLIRWPGAAAGERTQAVATCDLFFTLLKAAGLSPLANQPADGIDMSAIVRDPQAKASRDSLYWHYPHYYETTTPASAIRSGDWKLLEYFEDGRRELFNLRDDPQESRDLADTQAEQAAELSRQLTAWRGGVGVKLPQPNPQFRSKK